MGRWKGLPARTPRLPHNGPDLQGVFDVGPNYQRRGTRPGQHDQQQLGAVPCDRRPDVLPGQLCRVQRGHLPCAQWPEPAAASPALTRQHLGQRLGPLVGRCQGLRGGTPRRPCGRVLPGLVDVGPDDQQRGTRPGQHDQQQLGATLREHPVVLPGQLRRVRRGHVPRAQWHVHGAPISAALARQHLWQRLGPLVGRCQGLRGGTPRRPCGRVLPGLVDVGPNYQRRGTRPGQHDQQQLGAALREHPDVLPGQLCRGLRGHLHRAQRHIHRAPISAALACQHLGQRLGPHVGRWKGLLSRKLCL